MRARDDDTIGHFHETRRLRLPYVLPLANELEQIKGIQRVDDAPALLHLRSDVEVSGGAPGRLKRDPGTGPRLKSIYRVAKLPEIPASERDSVDSQQRISFTHAFGFRI